MKKNKMMRLASGLLVAVLITTSTISGTFAKYVTEDSASDFARVAKFGVEVKASGSLFAETYIDAPATTGDLTVKSVGAADDAVVDNVVAPGTHNGATPIKFEITGTPEVAVKLIVDVKGYNETSKEYDKTSVADIYLGKGFYPNMTTGAVADVTEAKAAYYPVKFTLTQTKKGDPGTPDTTTILVDGGKLADVEKALEDLTTAPGAMIAPNTDLAKEIGTLTLTWAWAFDGAQTLNGTLFSADEVDQCDTLLGDFAADKLDGTTIVADAVQDYKDVTPDGDEKTMTLEYNLLTGLEITIAVEQVD